MAADLSKEVKISPETLSLKPGESVEVTVANTGARPVAYKLKTTRPNSVRPNKAMAMVKAGGNDKFKITFRPKPDEKPFTDADRVTVLFAALPSPNEKLEPFWKSPPGQAATRQVLKLEKAGEAKKEEKKEEGKKADKKPAKKEESEKETTESGTEKSEESEVETESGTESGSEATESEA